jgi:hypothetical protein
MANAIAIRTVVIIDSAFIFYLSLFLAYIHSFLIKLDRYKLLFERVYTAVRFIDDFKIFTIEINGTNTGSFYKNGYVTVIKYKMENGIKYDPPLSTNSTASFTLSPWESKKSYIYCSEDELKIDYSKIAEVYLLIGGAIDRVLDIK